MNNNWYDIAVKAAKGDIAINGAFDNTAPVVFPKKIKEAIKRQIPEQAFNTEFIDQCRKECLYSAFLDDNAPFQPVPDMAPAYYVQRYHVESAIEALTGTRISLVVE